MTKQDRYSTPILVEADARIHSAKSIEAYGPAAVSFNKVATIASVLTGKQLTPRDCALVQLAQKLVRDTYSPDNKDHRRDACGYLGILDEIQEAASVTVDNSEEVYKGLGGEHGFVGKAADELVKYELALGFPAGTSSSVAFVDRWEELTDGKVVRLLMRAYPEADHHRIRGAMRSYFRNGGNLYDRLAEALGLPRADIKGALIKQAYTPEASE